MGGRYNRAKYFWTTLAIGICFWVLISLIGLAADALGDEPATGGVIGLVIICLTIFPGAVVLQAFQTVKRLHDLDRPGWHFWLLYFVPFYNIYLHLVILFEKGTNGLNKYGPDPLAGK
jgi:uncharacterized membrane protein YhaH (DUF805 family)